MKAKMKPTRNGATRIRVLDTQVSCTVEGETVILNLADGRYYGLEPVGARIWELIQEPHTLSEIVTTLTGEYEISPEDCQRDVEAFLDRLAAQKLIGFEDPDGTG